MIPSGELNGIIFNDYDEDGTFWGLDTVDGWGSPGTDAEYTKKVGGHGSWANRSVPTLNDRVVALSGVVKALTYEARVRAQHALVAAVTHTLSDLSLIDIDGTRLTVEAQRDGEVMIAHNGYSFAWSAQMRCPDPRKYGDAISLSTGLPVSTGGLTWPVTWPVTWTGESVSGIIHIDNPGTLPSPVVMRIDGPVKGASVRHVASDKQLTIATSYPLQAGAWLEFDSEARTVLESGQASRNGYLTDRGWFQLDPGANDIIFAADVYQPAALLTVSTRPAYQ